MTRLRTSYGPDAALLRVKGSRAAPTLQQAALQLNLSVDDLDADFGVVPLDAEKQLYAVRTITPSRVAPPSAFSDPKIDTFGPD
jgi:hypothetical protein